MNALHGPVVHARGAERATVATAVAQNPVGVAKVVTVFPDGIDNVFVSVGMLLVDSVGNDADPLTLIVRFPIPLFPGHEDILIANILIRSIKIGTDNPPISPLRGKCQANKKGSTCDPILQCGIENLVLVERAEPQPTAHAVVVKFHAASLNYRDFMFTKGAYNPKAQLPGELCTHDSPNTA